MSSHRLLVSFGLVRALVCGGLMFAAGCGAGGAVSGSGGRSGSGGAAPASGGATGTSSGGSNGSTGGATPAGGGATGTATGGTTPATGGSSGTGGAATGSGGTSGTGGATPGTGGGGVAGGRGGTMATGGAGTGGRGGTTGTGGAGTGGSGTGTGGAPTGPLPAFPGADGAARTIKGGRGGAVYHVTKVDTSYEDTAEGTLRYGLTTVTGPRTIVFDVSGHFYLGRVVAGWNGNGNGWDTQSRLNLPNDVTIAGQTAPGPVVLHGGLVKVGGTNIILRNVTIAPGYGSRTFDEPSKPATAGDFPDSYVYDALDIGGTNIIIDHVTTVYGTDETISCNETANNLTIQYCNISQGQNYPQADAEASGVKYTGHALGSLLQAGSNAKISVHHNLYAHQKARLPRIGTETSALTDPSVGAYNDFRNNVFYNWLGTAGNCPSDQPGQANFVGNFYLSGKGGDDPVGGTSTALTTSDGGTAVFSGGGKVFQSGNVKDTNKDGDASDTTALTSADFSGATIQSAAYTQTPYSGTTETAAAAFARVLDYSGARWWERGPVDTRLINETRTGTGKIMAWADDPFNSSASEGTEWRALTSTASAMRPANFDTDRDGMPDAWETMHGLDPAVADNNGDFDNDGYTNLEEYINEVATWPATATLIFQGHDGVDLRYAQIQNWNVGRSKAVLTSTADAHWQPSRYDDAWVPAGTVVVDAVGQHARSLRITGATSPTLAVRAGWLRLTQDLRVGGDGARDVRSAPAGAGRVEHSGGTLSAARTVVLDGRGHGGGAAEYALSGGTLETPRLTKTGAAARFTFTGGTLSAGAVDFDLIADGGTIAPAGAAIGRTRVSGDLALNSGALTIDTDGRAADAVTVTGAAHLGGTLVVHTAATRPHAGTRWTILTATGGITGRFASVPRGYSATVEGNRVVLRTTGAAAMTTIAPPKR